MRYLSLFITLIVLLAACVPPAETNAPSTSTVISPTLAPMTPTTAPQTFPDPFDTVARMKRGVNLGNALEAPNEGEWGMTIQEEYFDLIKEAGFSNVRIPIRWSAHADMNPPYTIDPAFFARIDQVLNWALRRDLIVMINLHHYEEMATDPAAHEARYLALWQQIAEHYKDYPSALLFEPMNEPNGTLTTAKWNDLFAKVLAVIRESNPERNIVTGGGSWNAYDQVANLRLPEDDRHIIVTFHYYNPFQFTHQGAEWQSGSDAWLGTTWTATEAERADVDSHFDQVAAWAKANDRPVFLGEFGAYSKAPQTSRVTWTDYIARAAEARGFAWAYWEFGAGFGVYDRAAKQWRGDLLKALMP